MKKIVSSDETYTTVAVVHCETSTGIVNDVEAIGQIVKSYQPGESYI